MTNSELKKSKDLPTLKGLTLKNIEHAITILKKFEIDPKTNQPIAPNDDKSNLRRYIILKQILSTNKQPVLEALVKKDGWRMLSDWISNWWRDCNEMNDRVKNICEKSTVRIGDVEIRRKLKLDKRGLPGLNYCLVLLKCCGKLPLDAKHANRLKIGRNTRESIASELHSSGVLKI